LAAAPTLSKVRGNETQGSVMERSSVLAFLAAASSMLVAGCGGGADDAPAAASTPAAAAAVMPAPAPVSAAVQPGVLGAATFTAVTMPAADVYATWTGQTSCVFPYPTEGDRQARLRTLLSAGVSVQSTACARQDAELFACGQATNAVWMVETPGVTREQMKALGFEPAQGPTPGWTTGPCASN